MKSYMIALRGCHNTFDSQSPTEIQAILEKYVAWVDSLKQADIFEYGLPLTANGKGLHVKNGQVEVVDGPYVESKEALTGFFVVKAATLDDATAIARECPALQHGEAVEVIEVGNC